MERVSSVTAFLYSYLHDPDAQAAGILNALDATERRAVETLLAVRDPDERRRALGEATGTEWSASRYEHVVDRALNRLQQLLQQHHWLQ